MSFVNVGLSLKIPKKLRKAKVDWHKAYAVAKIAGPVIAVAFPAAAPAVAVALVALRAADKGDPKAIAQLAMTEAAARSGNPEAAQALKVLKVARAVQKQQNAAGLLEAAKAGDPEAGARIEAAVSLAKAGDTQAKEAVKVLKGARDYSPERVAALAEVKAKAARADAELPGPSLARKSSPVPPHNCACPYHQR